MNVVIDDLTYARIREEVTKGLIDILAADVVGYSALMEQDEQGGQSMGSTRPS